MTRPARMFVAGLASGALDVALEAPLERREVPNSGTNYRILVASPLALSGDLGESRNIAPRESYKNTLATEA